MASKHNHPVPFNMASGTIPISGMALLWTNPSLTSNFSSQTISLDLSKYKYIIIELSQATSSDGNHVYTEICLIDGKDHMLMTNFSGAWWRRITTVSTSGVTFGTCEQPSGGSDNSKAIPIHIYGVN